MQEHQARELDNDKENSHCLNIVIHQGESPGEVLKAAKLKKALC
ncbi:hypothetical protein T02_2108 [Trichinella nativa]|uniref:Uncharacterized protein n=1 Tax=Trichinella nativa TaxID=6335 RepID=A0A0V1KQY6_9BILA|nr:hypothetical protein T02_2108 [Trichinella nativa]